MIDSEYITASEISDYTYCKRGWWLRLNGKLETTPQMLQGILDHTNLSNLVTSLDRKKLIAWILIGIGTVAIGVLFAFLSLRI